MRKILKRLLSKPPLFLINVYQRTLSPDHSFWSKKFFPYGYCKFYPSCSEYARQAIKKRGATIGLLKACWRVLRCNPWSQGGIDKL